MGKSLKKATDADFDKPNALRQGLSEDIYALESRGELQILGFWAVVEAGKDLRAEMEFLNNTLSNPPLNLRGGSGSYSLLLKHQPGSGETNYQILVDGVIKANGRLDRDVNIPLWTK